MRAKTESGFALLMVFLLAAAVGGLFDIRQTVKRKTRPARNGALTALSSGKQLLADVHDAEIHRSVTGGSAVVQPFREQLVCLLRA